MKNTIFVVGLFLLSMSPVLAQRGRAQKAEDLPPREKEPTVVESATQNGEVKIQIQQVDPQEETNENSEDAARTQPKRQLRPRDRVSQVAQEVEELAKQASELGGIGDQVSDIAKNQNQAQKTIDQQLDKLEKRPGWVKRIVGPNRQAIKVMNRQIEQNQQRIQKLNQVKTQLQNEGVENQVQNAIQVLEEQNTALQNEVKNQLNQFSLIGWLSKLFS